MATLNNDRIVVDEPSPNDGFCALVLEGTNERVALAASVQWADIIASSMNTHFGAGSEAHREAARALASLKRFVEQDSAAALLLDDDIATLDAYVRGAAAATDGIQESDTGSDRAAWLAWMAENGHKYVGRPRDATTAFLASLTKEPVTPAKPTGDAQRAMPDEKRRAAFGRIYASEGFSAESAAEAFAHIKVDEAPIQGQSTRRVHYEAYVKRVAPAYGIERDERDRYEAYAVDFGWGAWSAALDIAYSVIGDVTRRAGGIKTWQERSLHYGEYADPEGMAKSAEIYDLRALVANLLETDVQSSARPAPAEEVRSGGVSHAVATGPYYGRVLLPEGTETSQAFPRAGADCSEDGARLDVLARTEVTSFNQYVRLGGDVYYSLECEDGTAYSGATVREAIDKARAALGVPPVTDALPSFDTDEFRMLLHNFRVAPIGDRSEAAGEAVVAHIDMRFAAAVASVVARMLPFKAEAERLAKLPDDRQTGSGSLEDGPQDDLPEYERMFQHDVTKLVLDHIDRMNDVCFEDPADTIVESFTAKFRPIFDAYCAAKFPDRVDRC